MFCFCIIFLRRREEGERERAVGPSRLSWVCVSVCVRVAGGGQGDKNGLPKEGTEREREREREAQSIRLSACPPVSCPSLGPARIFFHQFTVCFPPGAGAEARSKREERSARAGGVDSMAAEGRTGGGRKREGRDGGSFRYMRVTRNGGLGWVPGTVHSGLCSGPSSPPPVWGICFTILLRFWEKTTTREGERKRGGRRKTRGGEGRESERIATQTHQTKEPNYTIGRLTRAPLVQLIAFRSLYAHPLLRAQRGAERPDRAARGPLLSLEAGVSIPRLARCRLGKHPLKLVFSLQPALLAQPDQEDAAHRLLAARCDVLVVLRRQPHRTGRQERDCRPLHRGARASALAVDGNCRFKIRGW